MKWFDGISSVTYWQTILAPIFILHNEKVFLICLKFWIENEWTILIVWFSSVVQNTEFSGGVKLTAIFTTSSHWQQHNYIKVIGIVIPLALSISWNNLLAIDGFSLWRVYYGSLGHNFAVVRITHSGVLKKIILENSLTNLCSGVRLFVKLQHKGYLHLLPSIFFLAFSAEHVNGCMW